MIPGSATGRSAASVLSRGTGFVLKLPIHIYRYTLKAFVGWHCRHLPTCSEYALEAIDRNGPWRGLWLTGSRLWRCRPGGSSGYDPVPDITDETHALMPWRYGRWRRVHQPGEACTCTKHSSTSADARPDADTAGP